MPLFKTVVVKADATLWTAFARVPVANTATPLSRKLPLKVIQMIAANITATRRLAGQIVPFNRLAVGRGWR